MIESRKSKPVVLATVAIVLVAGSALAQPPSVMVDNEGLGAYSQEATEAAKARLKETIAAVFVGARHGFIEGRLVSLDPDDWQTEAVVMKGKVMVPREFALAAFGIKRLPWFGFRIATRRGMVSIADLASRQRKKVFEDGRGLVIVTETPMTLTDSELLDSIVTLFDTPEKFAVPSVAARNIPSLKAWGNWKDHVRFTPEQLALYDGPERDWSLVPERDYQYRGYAPGELRSPLPPPGTHPRVLFGPDDIAAIAQRIQVSSVGRAAWSEFETSLADTWLDPNTSDGAIFRRLCAGAPAGLEMDGSMLQGPMLGIEPVRIGHVAHGLSTIALYSLLAGDTDLGGRTATAVSSYCQLLEPRVDACNRRPEVLSTHWREVDRALGGADLGLCYDLAAPWMTDDEKSLVRRVLAKAIAGRRGYGQEGPVRVRDVNRVAQEMRIFLANVAIEGQAGFDREIYDRGVETAKAFLQWGISPAGTLYESDAPGDEGLETLMLSIVAMARRGDNLLGHPHLRRLLVSQIQCLSPAGNLTTPRGSYTTGAVGRLIVDVLKTFYPDDSNADFLLAHFSRLAPDKGPRWLPFLYAAPWRRMARIDLGLPLDFRDDAAGVFASRSDNTGTAVWVCMQARPDLYVGRVAPHDAGAFYLEADGVLWGGWQGPLSSRHSIVFINGIGQDDGTGLAPPRVNYFGAETSEAGAIATADLSYAYDYVWASQLENWNEDRATGHRWEIETDPFVVNVLKGTQRYRINYGPAPLNNPWSPTLRAEFNPVQYAFRSVGLIRGNHPYVVVADDIRKDDRAHQYEWRMMGGHDTRSIPGLDDGVLVLAPAGEEVQRGTPMLLINEVGPSTCRLENSDGYTRVATTAVAPRFRLLLIPFRWGAEVPRMEVNEEAGIVTVTWRDQADTLEFLVGKDDRTRISVLRDGKQILESR